IRANRPRIVSDALTVLAWYHAARPQTQLRAWGSFEGWSETVRAPVVALGMPDPAEAKDELSVADPEATALRDILKEWIRVAPDGMTAKECIARADEDGELRSALHAFAPPRDGKKITSQALGMRLHHSRGRIVGGRCFVRDPGTRDRWRVTRARSGTPNRT